MKLFLGVDSSTTCTGFFLINENNERQYYSYVYTREIWNKATTYGESFTNIAQAFDMVFDDLEKFKDEIVAVGIEFSSMGSAYSSSVLGVVDGILIEKCRMFHCPKYMLAVCNWRAKIIDEVTNSQDFSNMDMQNNDCREFLKFSIIDWCENTYKCKLPKFENKSDGIRYYIDKEGNISFSQDADKSLTPVTRMEVNDISDAAGIAYGLLKGYVGDRKEIRNEHRAEDKQLRKLKMDIKKEWKKVKELKKQYEKDKSDSTYKKYFRAVQALKEDLNKLKPEDKSVMFQRIEKEIYSWDWVYMD